MASPRANEAPQQHSQTTRFARLRDLRPQELAGRILLVRIDAAVPIGVDERFWNEKFDPVLPTLDYSLSAGASVLILSHVRAADERSAAEAQRAIGRHLALLLAKPVNVLDECCGSAVTESIASLKRGAALLSGNLELEPGERQNQPELARFLAGVCDFYCNEAFPLAHEVRASTVGVARLARRSLAGLDFERQASTVALTLDHPAHPFMAIFGGSLSLNKLLLLESISSRADVVLIGGEVSLAFLAADGFPTGAVQVDEELAEAASQILRSMRSSERELLYPQDFVLIEAQELARLGLTKDAIWDPGFNPGSLPASLESRIGPSEVACDIGIRTRSAWSERLSPARTIFWHGPLGICELPLLQSGSLFIAEQIACRTWSTLHRTIVCGESLVRTIRGSALPFERIHFLSPAGQAILNYAAGRPLPALEALQHSCSKELGRPSVVLALTGTEDDMPLARDLAKWLPDSAAIHCVLVESKPDEDRYPDIYFGVTKEERLTERYRAERVFARVDAALASQGMTAATEALIHGDPSDKLIQRARELAADLIVLGTSPAARRRYSKEKVIAGAPCDVLVMRLEGA
jgi:3-phosphoglycerate kinase/nucleotide-binding universal stress UspA family protein